MNPGDYQRSPMKRRVRAPGRQYESDHPKSEDLAHPEELEANMAAMAEEDARSKQVNANREAEDENYQASSQPSHTFSSSDGDPEELDDNEICEAPRQTHVDPDAAYKPDSGEEDSDDDLTSSSSEFESTNNTEINHPSQEQDNDEEDEDEDDLVEEVEIPLFLGTPVLVQVPHPQTPKLRDFSDAGTPRLRSSPSSARQPNNTPKKPLFLSNSQGGNSSPWLRLYDSPKTPVRAPFGPLQVNSSPCLASTSPIGPGPGLKASQNN